LRLSPRCSKLEIAIGCTDRQLWRHSSRIPPRLASLSRERRAASLMAGDDGFKLRRTALNRGAPTISPSYVCTMASCNSEMNRRIFEAAGRLSDEERRAERGGFWRSVHGTLSHILWAGQMQMSRFAQWPKPVAPIEASGEGGVNLEALWRERETFDHALLEWAAGLARQWRDVTSSKALLVVHVLTIRPVIADRSTR
jgi:DinB family